MRLYDDDEELACAVGAGFSLQERGYDEFAEDGVYVEFEDDPADFASERRSGDDWWDPEW